MNAMIRAVKGTLAVVALAGLGWLLHWMTAGSISGLRTYDLDSLTVLAVGTIAWIAYIWLALAVVLTVLEQVPGVVGELAGAVAGRITTKTARALLRSGLGVAAVTPLTITAAHAAPDTAHVRQTDPQSANQLPGTSYRSTEAASRLKIGGQDAGDFRATEPASTLNIGGTEATEAGSSLGIAGTPHQDANDYRATEPPSTLQIGGSSSDVPRTSAGDTAQHRTTDDYRPTEPASTLPITPSSSGEPAGGERTGSGKAAASDSTSDKPASSGRPADSARMPSSKPAATEQEPGGRGRVGVPDRPTDGAPTRYTDLRPNVPVSIVVREGDSLWTIAARELGPTATSEAITARWHDWYSANRHVIGSDPDLILPGQVLRTPPTPNGDHLPPHHQEQ